MYFYSSKMLAFGKSVAISMVSWAMNRRYTERLTCNNKYPIVFYLVLGQRFRKIDTVSKRSDLQIKI